MSEPENFLSRWARLKRQGDKAAEASEAAQTPDGAASDVAADETHPAEPTDATEAPAPTAPAFDTSSLPPIEAITATTDIRAFLAPGVPPDLARAALRRAWVADPAIRDFIGIAENQWDFNDPNAIPGFGALGPLDDVRRLVAQVIGGPPDRAEDPRAVEESSSDVGAGSDSIAAEPQESAATEGHLASAEEAHEISTLTTIATGAESPAAAQQNDGNERSAAPMEVPARRTHGGALPR